MSSERRRLLMGQGAGGGGGLPTGYTQYDWIETDRNARINLGRVLQTGFRLETIAKFPYINSLFGVCGYENNYTGNFLGFQGLGVFVGKYPSTAGRMTSSWNGNTFYDLEFSNIGTRRYVKWANQTPVDDERGFESKAAGDIGLLGCSNYAGLNGMAFKETKLYNPDLTLAFDLIPCTDNDGTPCMYDLVGRQTYYNAGTGSFTVGNDD